MIDARTEFNRIFGDVVMSDNDAAWYIFKAGWNAARASGSYEQNHEEQEGQINPYCCHACFKKSGKQLLDRMILCPNCGNKRCPNASNHNLECTSSNEPGQPGSVYTESLRKRRERCED